MIKKLLNKHRRIILFIIGGGISASTEFLLFLMLDRAMNSLYWPAFLSFCGGLAVSFVLNKLVVFRSKADQKRFMAEVGMFVVLGVVNSQVSAILTMVLAGYLHQIIAKIVTMAMIAGWNYIVMSRLIFIDKNKSRDDTVLDKTN
jgi:putative flippase GtrA